MMNRAQNTQSEAWKVYHEAILGLESASEQKSFSQESASIEGGINGEPVVQHTPASLLDLDNSHPWTPSTVLQNIETVRKEYDLERLTRLLSRIEYHEEQLANNLPTVNPLMIAQRSEALQALCELTEKIYVRLSLPTSQAKPNQQYTAAKLINGLWQVMPNFSPFKYPSGQAFEGKIQTELSEIEWKLSTIKKLSPLLDKASCTDVLGLLNLVVEQICYVWVKQKKEMSYLRKEQFKVANLALVKSLKSFNTQQLKVISLEKEKEGGLEFF